MDKLSIGRNPENNSALKSKLILNKVNNTVYGPDRLYHDISRFILHGEFPIQPIHIVAAQNQLEKHRYWLALVEQPVRLLAAMLAAM